MTKRTVIPRCATASGGITVGWFHEPVQFRTRTELVQDLARYPELRLLDRFDVLPPIALAAILYFCGDALAAAYPSLQTSGPQLLIWGFFISTVLLHHATFTVNSLAHTLGRRRYATRDHSRNNWLLALLTFGEGWHNNRHHFPGSAQQGFYWWEVDLTYYVLRALAACGLIWYLKTVPARLRDARRVASRELVHPRLIRLQPRMRPVIFRDCGATFGLTCLQQLATRVATALRFGAEGAHDGARTGMRGGRREAWPSAPIRISSLDSAGCKGSLEASGELRERPPAATKLLHVVSGTRKLSRRQREARSATG